MNLVQQRIRRLIDDLDDCLHELRNNINNHAKALGIVAQEAEQGVNQSVIEDNTIQVTPLVGSNQTDLMAKIAEHNARLLVRRELQAILEVKHANAK